MVPSTDPAERPLRGLSLRQKTLLAFVLVALAPFGLAAGLLSRSYGDIVRESEERMQLLAVREVAASLGRHVAQVEIDARAVAHAFALVSDADRKEEEVLGAVRAVLSARPTLDGVRLEIPTEKVDLPFVKAGHDASSLPSSDAELRAAADARGHALVVRDARRGTLVVRVPLPAASPPAYVTAPLWLGPVEQDLIEAAERNEAYDRDTQVLVVDEGLRVVASLHHDTLATGADARGLAIWSLLGGGSADGDVTGAHAFAVAGIFDDAGTPRFGTLQVVPESGFRIAVSRPEAVALRAYHQARSTFLAIGGAGLLVAALLAMVAAGRVSRPVLALAAQARRIGRRVWPPPTEVAERADELGQLGRSLDRMASDLRAGEAQIVKEAELRTDLSRFLGQELVESIVRGEHSLELGGTRREVTVVFADVVAFTPLAETQPPEASVAMLNELFTILSEVVFRHGGTVDKFVGDSVMAVFGAPLPAEDHAARGLAAATEMISFVESAADDWRERFGVEVRLGIGVNSGEVLVGNIGSKKRMEYTVIGDAVNVAARLEALAAPNQILVGDRTRQLVPERSDLRAVGARALAGKKDPIAVHEVALDG